MKTSKRLNRYQKSSSERVYDLAEKSELLPFDPVYDEWSEDDVIDKHLKEQFYQDLFETLDARADGTLTVTAQDCPQKCDVRCECIAGHYRDANTGRCVQQNLCTKPAQVSYKCGPLIGSFY